MRISALAVIAAINAAPAEATPVHKWRDAAGNVHFGDKPPANTTREVVTINPNVYASPSIERLSDVFETRNEVVMYSASWCGYCK